MTEKTLEEQIAEKPESKAKNPPVQPVQQNLERPTADDIYVQVARNARRELKRGNLALALSGLVGGIPMGLTPLAASITRAQLGPGSVSLFASHFFYPVGFIAVIVGRAQLFTENTLYPVALVLAERRHVWNTLRLWAVVLPSNILGAFLFALLAARTGALKPEYVSAMTRFGLEATQASAAHIFWSAVIGGWIIAMVAWLVSGSHSITGAVMLIWLLAFVVGLGGFAHCVASSGEIFSAVLQNQLTYARYFQWLLPAVAGNILGGVLMVTFLEYGQVKAAPKD